VLLGLFFFFPLRHAGHSIEAGNLDWYAKALGQGLYLQVFWKHLRDRRLRHRLLPAAGYPLGFLIATTTPFWATWASFRAAPPLDLRPGAHLCLDGASGPQRRLQPPAARCRVIADPLPLLHNLTGVLIGMVHVLLPLYGAADLWAPLKRLDPAIVVAAEGLGASSCASSGGIYCRSR